MITNAKNLPNKVWDMIKSGKIAFGILVSVGVGYYLFHKIDRENFKNKCIRQGGTLIGQWECKADILEEG